MSKGDAMQRFRNKKVIVTGGARGIGRVIVRAFIEEGAVVWTADIDERGLGRLHVLVNNVAVTPMEPILEIGEESWNRTLAVNLNGPFFACQAAARHMISSGGGVLVNITSANAFRVESSAAHYNTSKSALVMMTRCFAHELGHLGIRANCVAPGLGPRVD